MTTHHEYSGYLRTLLHAPDPNARHQVEHVYFSADDLMHWELTDRKSEKEWQQIPVRRERTAEGVRIEGNFAGVRRIDNVGEDDPSFWVALGTVNIEDGRFPIDVNRFPILEIAYRCTSAHAQPAVVWSYDGGEHFDGLRCSKEWRTIVRRVQHFGFPERISALTLRLYAATRTTESFEVQSICFRALTPGEAEAIQKRESALAPERELPHYPLLDEFLPLGCYMSAATAKRMADKMETPFRDYWRLALEDIVRQHHNAIVLHDIDALTQEEWREILSLAQSFDVRIVAMHEWPLEHLAREGHDWIDAYVRPYADSPALLAWSVCDEPPEGAFQPHLGARKLIEESDAQHPLAVIMRSPDAFPLFAPYFAASGVAYYASKNPWGLGDTVRTHLPLSKGQQFWVTGPGFVWASDTPEWKTCPEMRLMLNLAFANGARGWFSFTYHNDPIWLGGNCQRSLTGPFLCFSDLWTELAQRMERFAAMAPLLLNAIPCGREQGRLTVEGRPHPRSELPEHVPPVQWMLLRGPDCDVYYVVNNDIDEVTGVNLGLQGIFEQGYEVYDVTDFVRTRIWKRVDRNRHIEMFPGQGQIFLAAPGSVCTQWRDRIVQRMIENDRRQITIDLGLARRYDLDIGDIQGLLRRLGMGEPMEELHHVQGAREHILNLIYDCPDIARTRTRLVEVSAMLCACDGTLCRLLGRGKGDAAHELGLLTLPLARRLTDLRLKLRRGRGREIQEEAAALAADARQILEKIRAES